VRSTSTPAEVEVAEEAEVIEEDTEEDTEEAEGDMKIKIDPTPHIITKRRKIMREVRASSTHATTAELTRKGKLTRIHTTTSTSMEPVPSMRKSQ